VVHEVNLDEKADGKYPPKCSTRWFAFLLQVFPSQRIPLSRTNSCTSETGSRQS
jgi:hypothetical protein